MTAKLSVAERNEFRDALGKGLGRALLHVRRLGLEGVADLVLRACLHDQAYDPQCEPSKAKWLYRMFKNTPHRAAFRAAILRAIRAKRSFWDLRLICGLTLELARDGDPEAWAMLRDFALKEARRRTPDDLGSEQWLELAGIEGAVDLARAYGKRLIADPDDFVPDEIGAFAADERSGRSRRRALDRAAGVDPAVRAYVEYLCRRGAFDPPVPIDREAAIRRTRHRIRNEYDVARILRDARRWRSDFPAYYLRFGRFATAKERQTIYEALLRARNNEVRLRLLWVFSRAAVPRVDDLLIDLAEGAHPELKAAAIEALAQLSHPRVHELARRKARSGAIVGPDSAALSLFLRNYDASDASLICRAVSRVRANRDDSHTLASDVADIAEQHHDRKLGAALRWGYENTPCVNCRERIVAQLDAISEFKGAIRRECLFDCSDEIAGLAAPRRKTRG